MLRLRGMDRMLAGELNFYSPYYRQVTLETIADTALVAERSPLAMGDVLKSFDYYLEHYNGGKPFILAGFSQGAMAVVELLKHLDNDAASRMVAAYVIGWKVTDADTIALDTASLLLCADGYTRDDYMLPFLGIEGNYHCLEISLYADALRRNMALRAGRKLE